MPESTYKVRESSYPLQEIRAVRRYAITKARHAATSGRAFQNENVEKLREMAEKGILRSKSGQLYSRLTPGV
jgi:hypothetical protein